VNLKPGDLVRINDERVEGVEVYIFELVRPNSIFIVEQVTLISDPLGPTGHLTVRIVDPTDGTQWNVDGNWLERVKAN